MSTESVLVVSYSFYPENNPRAFRTFELSRALANSGLKVRVVIPKIEYDYTELQKETGIEISFVDEHNKTIRTKPRPAQAGKLSTSASVVKIIKRLLKPIYQLFFPSGSSTFYFVPLLKKLSKERKQYDAIISIGSPFSVNLGMALVLRLFPSSQKARTKIVEYSDPFSMNPDLPYARLYSWIDRFICSQFDHIVVPVQKAISSFGSLTDQGKVKVIPQGFDFSDITRDAYTPNTPPHFCYGGLFYKKVRNPAPFLEYLAKSEEDFRFIVYTNYSHSDTREVLQPYEDRLKGRLSIRPLIPRLQLIKEMSRMDFLINMDNASQNQVPSKLIDYALARRPIFTFSEKDLNIQTFSEFIKGKYSDMVHLNIEEYSIKNVVNRFLELMALPVHQ